MTESKLLITRPEPPEYSPFYDGYVRCAPEGGVLGFLASQRDELIALLGTLSEDALENQYEEGKWSIRQVLGHIIDTEWIFSYRMLRFARGDETPLPGMDQDEFMEGANFESRSGQSLLDEFSSLRSAMLSLSSSFSDDILRKRGNASGVDFTVRALIWIVAGHCQHHINVLNESYLRI